MSGFNLPDNNIQISFSGGRTSAFMLYKIVQENEGLPDNVKVLFANTGREMPETLDFVRDCQEKWGVDVVWLEYDKNGKKTTYKVTDYENASREGEPFEKLIESRNHLPNTVMRFCTSELKVLTMKRYLTKECGWKKWVSAIGIRYDEVHRVKQSKDKRWENWYPLVDAEITKQEMHEFWQRQNFNLDLPTPNGSSPKGNCDFCFLKSEAILASMVREHPERVVWWQKMEQKIGSTFRDKRDMTKFTDFIQRQRDWIFDDESFLCQASDGECTE